MGLTSLVGDVAKRRIYEQVLDGVFVKYVVVRARCR